jgi:bifunctional non-homologous end joining protein LigD
MPLEEYRRKRDFAKTPEPQPARATRRQSGLSYLVQKHDATRLHYDFRLELDGVLLSWAVTKGPSLNPADKRLAVRTEDHPLSYGEFEGTIPKGQYGGGTVMLWDQGTWEPKGDPHFGLKKGHLAFVLHGERLKGGWDLIRMRGEDKRENWLLIKVADSVAKPNGRGEKFLERLASSVKTGRTMEEIAASDAPAPRKAGAAGPKKKERTAESSDVLQWLMERYPEVQLATLVDNPPEGAEWLHEIKLDGYRLLGFVSGGVARLRTRNGKDWTTKFPALVAGLKKLKVRDAVLDMEAVVLDDKGKSSFQALQHALGDGGESDQIIAYVFDLLHLDGKDLRKLALTERKKTLQALLGKLRAADSLRYSDHVVGRGGQVFKKACENGWEGIVSKRADAPYIAARQRTWLKTKCGLRQEFIILGYSDARTGGRALGALYLGYRKDGGLQYGGKVGTGFTMAGARELVDRFDALVVDKPLLTTAETKGLTQGEWKSIHWVRPVLLCEVAFTEWTQDGRARHPSFQGLREDKSSKDVKKETPVTTKASELVLSGVTITHPDRVISNAGHITKGDVAEYYAAVAPFLLPSIARRPISLLRCPSGLDENCFYQRSPGKGLGPDVHPFQFRHKGKSYEYLYIEDEKGLLEVVQMGAIEIHPWGARIDAIDTPDWLIFDLDPAPEVPFEALKLAAQDLRQRLKANGLECTLKCTGGKGLHVTVPLAAKDKWPRVKSFAAALADEMVAAAPEAYIATMSKAKRTGKIFIDYFRNDYTATAIADYSVRARSGAPVAVPIEWNELKSLRAASQFTMKDVLQRLKGKKPDLAARKSTQTIPA